MYEISETCVSVDMHGAEIKNIEGTEAPLAAVESSSDDDSDFEDEDDAGTSMQWSSTIIAQNQFVFDDTNNQTASYVPPKPSLVAVDGPRRSTRRRCVMCYKKMTRSQSTPYARSHAPRILFRSHEDVRLFIIQEKYEAVKK
ncbi:hypothetical protein OSTOST_12241 [Ostertagia ostertagi]